MSKKGGRPTGVKSEVFAEVANKKKAGQLQTLLYELVNQDRYILDVTTYDKCVKFSLRDRRAETKDRARRADIQKLEARIEAIKSEWQDDVDQLKARAEISLAEAKAKTEKELRTIDVDISESLDRVGREFDYVVERIEHIWADSFVLTTFFSGMRNKVVGFVYECKNRVDGRRRG
jgi:hypothetical protein